MKQSQTKVCGNCGHHRRKHITRVGCTCTRDVASAAPGRSVCGCPRYVAGGK